MTEADRSAAEELSLLRADNARLRRELEKRYVRKGGEVRWAVTEL